MSANGTFIRFLLPLVCCILYCRRTITTRVIILTGASEERIESKKSADSFLSMIVLDSSIRLGRESQCFKRMAASKSKEINVP